MLKRKTTSPYLIYSLIIHVTLLLVMWWVTPQQVPVLPFYDEIEVSITHVERPPLPIEQPTFVEPAAPVVVQKKKPKPPPKPKAGLSATWQLETKTYQRFQNRKHADRKTQVKRDRSEMDYHN